jgi:hypothetical protein
MKWQEGGENSITMDMMICAVHRIILEGSKQDSEMGGTCSPHEGYE